MKLHQLFPTLIYQKQIISNGIVGKKKKKKNERKSFLEDILQECYRIKKIDLNGRKWSQKNYPGGYTSYGSLTELHKFSPYFHELSEFLNKEVTNFAKLLDMDLQGGKLELCSLWVNIMPKGVTHSMHIHPHSVISGTFYVQVPKGTRGLKIEDPRMIGYMNTPPRKKSAKTSNQWFVELEPNPGSILLFESWVRHEVPPNPTKEDRVSISFNYHWVS